jgi:hypothetical protein
MYYSTATGERRDTIPESPTETWAELPAEYDQATWDFKHLGDGQGYYFAMSAEELAARQAAMQRVAVDAVQLRLDTQAQAWGYDNIFTACTYADEPAVPQFQAEGQALRAWRSQTWSLCYANVDAPSLDALLALLPAPPARPT